MLEQAILGSNFFGVVKMCVCVKIPIQQCIYLFGIGAGVREKGSGFFVFTSCCLKCLRRRRSNNTESETM